MYEYHLQEMSQRLAELTGTPAESILSVMKAYWKDKIAITWSAEDVIGTAIENGYVMSDSVAADILQEIMSHHNAEQGVSWTTLRVYVEDTDRREWFRKAAKTEDELLFCKLTAESVTAFDEVYGPFLVWRWIEPGQAEQATFGEEGQTDSGYLAQALDHAMQVAKENENSPIFVALRCERREYDDAPDLFVLKRPEEDDASVYYARGILTGKEHRRTLTEAQAIARDCRVTVSDDNIEALLEDLEGEYDFPFDVTDEDIRSRLIGGDPEPREDMDGDHQSALASAGLGTDEDYCPEGCGSEEDW